MATKRACVIGWPIRHSRSPLIHNFWLRKYGIDGEYVRREVEPAALERFLGSMAEEGFTGCNVTLPHKEAVFRAVQVTDPFTRRLGAVNTVYFDDGSPCGLNTDGAGFLDNLKSASPDWRPQAGPAMVLGAGGAARAVITMLMADGVPEVRIANRTPERAQALAKLLRPNVSPVAWEEREQGLADCALLVNTTSLGMTGAPPLRLSLDCLPHSATVNDIVYAPLETDLLARARRRGNAVVDGLGMLLHQAVPGFALWFGVRPEVTPDLRALVVADLEAE